MNRNVEVKVRIQDRESVRLRIEAMADQTPEELDQEDIFFHCGEGRLKLRILSPRRGELIFYSRPDSTEPKGSRYLIYPTTDPEKLQKVLAQALGKRGVVRKRRSVYRTGQTRIHLDRVEGLGDFLELEVVLRPDQAEAEGSREAHRILDSLSIPRSAWVAGAYIDLLEKDGSG